MKRMGLALALALAPAALAAQDMEAVRSAQVNMMQNERRMVLAMIDSMPDAWFRDKATPAQRDFAMQLYHAVSAVPFVAGVALGRAALPAFGGMQDSTTATASKASLRTFTNATYDWAAGAVRAQPAAQRMAAVTLFGQHMTGWEVWDEIHQHTMWTLGQTVANFRGHGMAPPAFMFF